MGLDVAVVPSVGDATKVSDYQRLRDNDVALQAGDAHDFGGDLRAYITDTTEVDLPNSSELEIVGANLAGRSVYVEVTCQARMADGSAWTGSVTCTVDLYNVTAVAPVASSAVATVLSSETRTRNMSSAITLGAATNRYKIRIKSSSALRGVAARVRVVIR